MLKVPTKKARPQYTPNVTKYDDWVFLKEYEHYNLWSYKGLYRECFNPYDLPMSKKQDTEGGME